MKLHLAALLQTSALNAFLTLNCKKPMWVLSKRPSCSTTLSSFLTNSAKTRFAGHPSWSQFSRVMICLSGLTTLCMKSIYKIIVRCFSTKVRKIKLSSITAIKMRPSRTTASGTHTRQQKSRILCINSAVLISP